MYKRSKFYEIAYVVVMIILGVSVAFGIVMTVFFDRNDSYDDDYDDSHYGGYEVGFDEGYDVGYDEGYEEEYEEGYYSDDFLHDGIFYSYEEAIHFARDDGGWHPEEAWCIIEDYRAGNDVSREEYEAAIDSLIAFHEYYYNHEYEDLHLW